MTPKPRRKRRLLKCLTLVFLIIASVGGWNWWSYARIDAAYRERLEEYVRLNPDDSEGWFALETCMEFGYERSCKFPVKRDALDKAISLGERPLYLMAAVGDRPNRKSLDRLTATDSNNAAVWMASAGYLLEVGDVDGALVAVRRGLECRRFDDHGREAIGIHRRFARMFFGDGYTADSIILRRELAGAVFPWHFVSNAVALAGTEAARLRFTGDLAGARAILEALYRLGCDRWTAARDLCELALQEDSPQADFWKGVADPLEPSLGGFRGNIYAIEDPWIVRNSWPERVRHYDETLCGTWLPLWYYLHQEDFHAIAEGLGDPDLSDWRRADKLMASWRKKPRIGYLNQLLQERDILYRPVPDESRFNRLMALQSDAAVLTLLKSEWKPAPQAVANQSPTELYVLCKLGVLQLTDEPTRRSVAMTLARSDSDLWGADAWRLAAEIHRNAFIDEAIKNIGLYRGPLRIRVLREVTGQNIGYGTLEWTSWRFAQNERR